MFLRQQVPKNLKSLTRTNCSLFHTSSKALSFYAIKDQVDEFAYYHEVNKKLKPLVYRSKNAETLTSLNIVDSKGRTVEPRKYPGYPSKDKFVSFIDNLLVADELRSLESTFKELDRLVPDYLVPSLINAYLYKSAEFGEFFKGLDFVYSLRNYIKNFSSRNVDCISLIRYIQISKQEISDLKFIESKLSFPNKLNKKGISNLTNLIQLSLINKIYSNNLKFELNKINSKLMESLKTFEGINVKDEKLELTEPLKNYKRWSHAILITEAFKDSVNSLPSEEQKQYTELLNKIQPFTKHTAELQKAANMEESLFKKLYAKTPFEKKEPVVEAAEEPAAAADAAAEEK